MTLQDTRHEITGHVIQEDSTAKDIPRNTIEVVQRQARPEDRRLNKGGPWAKKGTATVRHDLLSILGVRVRNGRAVAMKADLSTARADGAEHAQ